MANTRGVFGLVTVQEKVFFNEWVPLSDVWIAPSPFYATSPNAGYFGGSSTTMDSVNYSSDTTAAVPTANLSAPRYGLAATGNSLVGYFGGGIPNNPARTDKLTYSTNTTVHTPIDLSTTVYGRFGVAATGNSTTGYFAGGYQSPSPLTLIDKIIYSSDTKIVSPNSLISARYYLAATGNLTAGYFGGGNTILSGFSSLSNMDKVIYSTDTTVAVPGANLTVVRKALAATGNTTAGYFGGGTNPGSIVSTMDKVTYSTDTIVQVPGASLSSPRSEPAATGSTTAGYFGGGNTPTTTVATMDKLTYSTDTTAFTPTANLRTNKSNFAATSPKIGGILDVPYIIPAPSALPKRYSDGVESISNNGYFSGGKFTSGVNYVTAMDKINYSTDTTALGGSLISARYDHAATGNATNGYFGGGSVGGATQTMEKFTYVSDTTVQVPSAYLSSSRYRLTATGNSTAGYFGGGNPGPTALVEKIIYSNDTRASVPTANLSISRNKLAATGNQTAGYFGGGTPTGGTRVDKLTYSNDTTVATPTANLSIDRSYLAATGNSTHGYFGGGYPGTSAMDKITYSTDTRVYTPTANLISTRYNIGATGNSTSGYFGGGGAFGGSSDGFTSMDKVTYSTDTTSISPTANKLRSRRGSPAATGARANGMPSIDPPTPTPTSTTYPYEIPVPNTGYFGGAGDASLTMDKVTYSTDTTTYTPTANLSLPRMRHAATGNSTDGYFGGGYDAGQYLTTTTMDKVTYSTDTTVKSPTAVLTTLRYYVSATGNSTNGYFTGGQNQNGSTQGSTDKVTYSTDIITNIPAGFAVYGSYATGNSTAGYFGGGYPAIPSIGKLSYSTDTIAYVTSLSIGRYFLAATGNSTHGYFGGGYADFPLYVVSRMDKVTYSNDTNQPTPTANLSSPRYFLAATGNSTNGYFGGGGGPVSTMDKVTYSTDTTVYTPTANLSGSRYGAAASSARANGLPQPTYTAPSPNIV